MTDEDSDEPPGTEQLLAAAVASIGGRTRPGQVRMAEEIGRVLRSGSDAVLVQAGTGTGKSLGYLVPAAAEALRRKEPIVISTATLALQRQLVEKDLPAVATALGEALGQPISFAVLKGRGNYVCRERLERGSGDPQGPTLFDEPTSWLGRQAQRVSKWAQRTDTGDRDDLPEPVDSRVWSAVSVSARECIGATRCPFGTECFAEAARDRARTADLIVTNHALLAIDLQGDSRVLPDHAAVIVDEAHELVDRVTGALTAQLGRPALDRALGRARQFLGESEEDALADAFEFLADVLAAVPEGRLRALPQDLVIALTSARDACQRALVGIRADAGATGEDVAARMAGRAGIEEVHDVAGAALGIDDSVVVWVSGSSGGRSPTLNVAPIAVAGLLGERLFKAGPVVLTSATLAVGATFEPTAAAVGAAAVTWIGLDVGSPFDHAKQAVLYCAADLPRPGREGTSDAAIHRLGDLLDAAGGRTLALFSSWRAVERAAVLLGERFGGVSDRRLIVARQGDAVAALVRAFAEDDHSSLLGTLSLWQGVDVPGASCSLVVIDRIPFPRPDDPLVSARSELVDAAGGSGFAAVSVPRAALLLAQGAGRLIRSAEDRGVVAILDPRLATTGYGTRLRRSLPPFWWTTDEAVVLGVLRRLDSQLGSAPDPVRT